MYLKKANLRKLIIFAMMGLLLLTACSTAETYQPEEVAAFDETEETALFYASEDTAEAYQPEDSAPIEISEDVENLPLATIQAGHPTPEGAVIAFLEGLRDMDFGNMLGALIDERAIAAFLDWSEYAGVPVIQEPNPRYALYEFIGRLNWLLEYYQSPLSPYDFQSLEVVGFIPEELYGELYLSESIQYSLSNQAQRWGAERMVSRVVIFELDAEKYALFVNVADYAGDWRVSDFGGTLFGLLHGAWWMLGLIQPEFVSELAYEMLGITDLRAVLVMP